MAESSSELQLSWLLDPSHCITTHRKIKPLADPAPNTLEHIRQERVVRVAIDAAWLEEWGKLKRGPSWTLDTAHLEKHES